MDTDNGETLKSPVREVDVDVDASEHIVATVVGFVIAWSGTLRTFLGVLSTVGEVQIGGEAGGRPRKVWRTWVPSGLLMTACGVLLISYGLGEGPDFTSPRAVSVAVFQAVAPLSMLSLGVLVLLPLAKWLGRKTGWTFEPLPWYLGQAVAGTALSIWWLTDYLSRSPRQGWYLLFGIVCSIPTVLCWAWVWMLIRDRQGR